MSRETWKLPEEWAEQKKSEDTRDKIVRKTTSLPTFVKKLLIHAFLLSPIAMMVFLPLSIYAAFDEAGWDRVVLILAAAGVLISATLEMTSGLPDTLGDIIKGFFKAIDSILFGNR